MIYPKICECPRIPEGEDIWDYAGITEAEYVYQRMGFTPRLVNLEHNERKPVFFSFFPYL